MLAFCIGENMTNPNDSISICSVKMLQDGKPVIYRINVGMLSDEDWKMVIQAGLRQLLRRNKFRLNAIIEPEAVAKLP